MSLKIEYNYRTLTGTVNALQVELDDVIYIEHAGEVINRRTTDTTTTTYSVLTLEEAKKQAVTLFKLITEAEKELARIQGGNTNGSA